MGIKAGKGCISHETTDNELLGHGFIIMTSNSGMTDTGRRKTCMTPSYDILGRVR